MNETVKVGDVITHMPSMFDESHAVVTAVHETGIEAWDFEYETAITKPLSRGDKPGTWFKKTSADRLNSRIQFATSTRRGSFTIRQLAEEAAAKFGIKANL